jgi:ATP-dependent DNA ligase
MSAEQRDFTNFEDFPGELTGTGYYEFPVISYRDSNDRTREWRIFVRMVKDGKRQTTIDWDPLVESQLDITNTHITDVNASMAPNAVAQYWTETGIVDGKTTRQAPTYVSIGKNQTRSNERNIIQQALIDARSRYLKQLQKSKSVAPHTAFPMLFPMLARPWEEGAKRIKYPAWVQRKYDGARCIAYLRVHTNPTWQDVMLYSRQKKPFLQLEYLQKSLLGLFTRYNGTNQHPLYLDGELYRHGARLQDISGEARRSVSASTSLLDYVVYDCFYLGDTDTFVQRQSTLDEIFAVKYKHISLAPKYPVKDFEELEKYFMKFVEAGYEGAIVRNAAGLYLCDANRTGAFLRSYDVVKMKKRFTDEYKLVGFTSGKGKDTGAIIWICETEEGKRFNVTPKLMDYPARKALYAEVSADNVFEDEWQGLMMTIEYEDLSADKIPLRAKALVVRQM